MITDNQFTASAKALNVEVAAIKAIAEVESSGDGFLADGKPKILFEPHIFWKQLRQKGIDPNLFMEENADILYPTWKPGAYGPVSKQHERMEKAARINRDAALLSASWGRFQIMGFNWKACG
ncbi:MAG TPA: N-acetylmuramidase family protein, partial [Flavisolibacter sp.]|nr:N-acetylmuramidase family protein [Flavisolibacter sp.]